MGGWLSRGLARQTILDRDVRVTAASTEGSSGPFDIAGGGEYLAAVAEIAPSLVNSGAHCIVQIETQLPNGDWHRVCRFARVTALSATPSKRLFSGARFNNDSIVDIDNAMALTQIQAADQMLPLTGPVRARYLCGRGTALVIDWSIKVAVGAIVRPAISG